MDDRAGLRADVRQAAAALNRWTDKLGNAIEAAYRSGVGLNQLAQDAGRSVEGIRKLLIRRGVPLRPPHVR